MLEEVSILNFNTKFYFFEFDFTLWIQTPFYLVLKCSHYRYPFAGFLIRVLYWLIIICLRNFLSWNFDFDFNSLFCFLWIWFYLMNSETLLPAFQALSLSLSLPFSGFLVWVLYWWVIICFRKFLSWNFNFNFDTNFYFLNLILSF